MENKKSYCGYVAIIGRPNVGKSTLLNQLLGSKISITSRKPQTTRHQVLGIVTQDNSQIVYVDTPGLHQYKKHQINRYMNRAAKSALYDVDVIVVVVEALRFGEQDRWVLSQLCNNTTPVLLVINKIDKVKDKNALLPFIDQIAQHHNFVGIFPVSAKQGLQVSELQAFIKRYLPVSPFLFADDIISNRDSQFVISETVREKLMRVLGDEVPYALTVTVDAMRDQADIVRIAALIWVEKESQKLIVIGQQGSVLKNVGKQARLDLESYFAKKVYLQLWVKVKTGWTDDLQQLKRFGYDE